MSNKLTIEVKSPEMIRLSKAFQELAYTDQRKVLISAFRKATKPTVSAVKINAPVRRSGGGGDLRKSIGLLVVRNEIAVIIAARRNRGFKGYHGHLVEDGTVDRYYTTKHGNQKFVGRMNPSGYYAGYFKRGVMATQAAVMNTLGDEFMASIDRFHRKHGIR